MKPPLHIKLTFFSLVCAILFSSCSIPARVWKGMVVHQLDTITKANVISKEFRIKTKAEIIEEKTYVKINPEHSPAQAIENRQVEQVKKGDYRLAAMPYYFPDPEVKNLVKRFTYLHGKPVLQALTIPLKIRTKRKDGDIQYPTQVESGFSLAFAYGQNWTWTTLRSEPNVLGEVYNRRGFSIGGLLGTGGADLKGSTTTIPIRAERRAAILSYGIFGTANFNKISAGYVVGIDRALGEDADAWVYQGRIWHGIAIGIELIK